MHRIGTSDADCLWVRLSTRVNAQLLELYPRVKCIVSPTTGTDHIDVAECEQRGVVVLSLQGETDFLKGVRATAEHTIGLMLWALRGWQNVATTNCCSRPRDAGCEVYGKTVGIVGWGRIGSQVARLVEAFGARAQPSHAKADIVTVHLPLNETTVGYCGDQFFSQLKYGTAFVNTSRAAIVNETALMKALQSGVVSRAVLDVSHMRGHLWEYARENPERVLITPHIGGYTRESLEKCELFMAEKLLNHIGTNGNDKSLRTGMCAGIPGTVA